MIAALEVVPGKDLYEWFQKQYGNWQICGRGRLCAANLTILRSQKCPKGDVPITYL
jgi:hypothetical protein